MAGVDVLASAMSGANATYLADLYARWAEKPDSVDPSFSELFGALNDEARAVLTDAVGASWAPRSRGAFGPEPEAPAPKKGDKPGAAPAAATNPVDKAAAQRAVLDSIRALMLIRSYRVRGHLQATLDPLGMEPPVQNPELTPEFYGFSESDLDKPIFLDGVLGLETGTLREVLALLKRTYCGHIGIQYMHIAEPEEKSWLQARIEGPDKYEENAFTREGKLAILNKLIEAETFERFLHKRFPGTKRFGLDGGEAMVPALEQVIKRGGNLGVDEIVLGMAHRGRLN